MGPRCSIDRRFHNRLLDRITGRTSCCSCFCVVFALEFELTEGVGEGSTGKHDLFGMNVKFNARHAIHGSNAHNFLA
eukprot:scaffold7242_cov53-Attheya_sp.AAC.2